MINDWNKRDIDIILGVSLGLSIANLVLLFCVTWPYLQTSLHQLQQEDRELLAQINVRVAIYTSNGYIYIYLHGCSYIRSYQFSLRVRAVPIKIPLAVKTFAAKRLW